VFERNVVNLMGSPMGQDNYLAPRQTPYLLIYHGNYQRDIMSV